MVRGRPQQWRHGGILPTHHRSPCTSVSPRGIAWLVRRVISDGADEAAAENFEDFVKRYEQQAWRLIESLLQRCNNTPPQCP